MESVGPIAGIIFGALVLSNLNGRQVLLISVLMTLVTVGAIYIPRRFIHPLDITTATPQEIGEGVQRLKIAQRITLVVAGFCISATLVAIAYWLYRNI